MRKITFSLVLLLALGVGAKLYWAQASARPIIILSCEDISQTCENELFTVHFSETPQVFKPFQLNVQMKRAEPVKSVYVDFAMQSMEMGLNRYRLIQAHSSGDWHADVTLPMCVQGRSDWNMLIEIEAGNTVKRFQLPFSARANRAN
jgi:hypothetical protein